VSSISGIHGFHNWKASKPVKKFNAIRAQGFLHPGGTIEFMPGLILDPHGRVIEAIQLSQSSERKKTTAGFGLQTNRSWDFLPKKIDKSLVNFVFGLNIIGPSKGREGLR
jgi:hypothetical protein